MINTAYKYKKEKDLPISRVGSICRCPTLLLFIWSSFPLTVPSPNHQPAPMTSLVRAW